MKRIAATLVALLIVSAGLYAGGSEESEAPAGQVDVSAVQTMPGYKSETAAEVHVQWKVSGDKLLVQMAAATTGWIAVGFDPSRQMADANIIIGYVADGKVFLRDDYGIGNVRHGADVDNGGTSNLADVPGEEKDGMTVIRFTIPLNSGDRTDKPLVAGSTYKIIAAHGPDGADDYGTYHGSRGSFETKL